jgi:hypothetical protein
VYYVNTKSLVIIMATIKPRLQILLKAETKLAIEKAASQMGVSASKLVCEFLDEALPAIKMVGDAFEEAKKNQADSSLKALNILKDTLLDARQSASDAQLDIEDVISVQKAKTAPKRKPRA